MSDEATSGLEPMNHALDAAAAMCPVQQRCGGCPQMLVPLEQQREIKQERLTRALAAAGVRVPWVGWLVGQRSVGYRNRIRLKLEGGRMRFFNQRKAVDCTVLDPNLLNAIEHAARWAESRRDLLEAYDYAEVRTFDMDRRAGLYLGSTRAVRPNPLPSELSNLPELVIGASRNTEGTAAPETLRVQRWALNERCFTFVPVGSFMQVNEEVNRLLIREVVELAVKTGAEHFCDLYCGSGNLSVPLLERGLEGSGVERDAAAIAAVQWAAQVQHFEAQSYIAADVARWATEARAAGLRFELVIANPPRAGALDALEAIAGLAARDLLLCYCRADSLVRDSAHLVAAGFRPQRLWCADMFPHTHHLEALLWLRAGPPSPIS